MDLLDGTKETNLKEIFNGYTIYTEDQPCHPQYIGSKAVVEDSLIDQGTVIHGEVKHSVVSRLVTVDKDAKIDHCVVMGNVKIHDGVVASYAVIAPDVEIKKGTQIIGDPEHIKLYAGEEK
jgi:glucose-1-phosphate adenylyltransferase